MDNPQYAQAWNGSQLMSGSFKPYYKWITFNTVILWNLKSQKIKCFKLYYKWITFNTVDFVNDAHNRMKF